MEPFLDKVVAALKSGRNIDLSGYREGTLGRRVEARMAKVCRGDRAAYVQRLQASPGECDRLIENSEGSISLSFSRAIRFELVCRQTVRRSPLLT